MTKVHGVSGESKDSPSLEGSKAKAGTHYDGQDFRRAIENSTVWLAAHIDLINSLNVYPVPDGDTGTNMYLTMQAALREMSTLSEHSVSAVARAVAHGALMGARGNSGVILSQVWRGVAKQLEGKAQLTVSDWALALQEGTATAYKGVMRPVEGTILTVAREAAQAAMSAAGESGDMVYVLEQTVKRAEEALQRTPDLLPVLKEAGVVDAGGQGLCVILDGMLRYWRGESTSVISAVKTRAKLEREQVPESEYGYDIQFLIDRPNSPVDDIRAAIMQMGDSVLVVGDAE
ncbi:MAG: DAK2 domain-containing protein, partial [Chloroflexi bacterium]|nr:DAK2 domain-containing protein [Chloroflexota bacterium]